MPMEKSRQALLAVSRGQPHGVNCCKATLIKARIIAKTAPHLVDDVLAGRFSFNAVYRWAVHHRKKVAP
jgi:hypothetical protein